MSLYRNILSQAWQITWRNKYLWFFGIFAALLGNGGEYEILIRSLRSETSQGGWLAWQGILATGVFSRNTLSNIKVIMAQDPLSLFLIFLICLFILVLIGFLVWLVIVSQVALVNSSASIIKQKSINFKDGLDHGIRKFWPVLGLNLVVRAVIYFVFILLSQLIILNFRISTLNFANLLYIVAFIIFIPLMIAFSFMIKYAIAYAVVNGSNFVKSVRQGWKLFLDNWLVSFEMAFILFFINILISLAIVLLISILAVPFLFLALTFYYYLSLVGFWLIIILALILFFVVIIISGAILANFQVASWIGLFLKLDREGGASKIIRVIDNIIKK